MLCDITSGFSLPIRRIKVKYLFLNVPDSKAHVGALDLLTVDGVCIFKVRSKSETSFDRIIGFGRFMKERAAAN